MKFCQECGKKVADNAQSCPECGFIFDEEKKMNIKIHSGKKKGSVGWLIFWFIFTGIGGFIYLLIRDWSRD